MLFAPQYARCSQRASVVPLQHHLGRRIRRVQVHVRVQRIADTDRQRRRCAEEIVLVQARRQRRLVRERARERRRIGARPVPALADADRSTAPAGAASSTQPAAEGAVPGLDPGAIPCRAAVVERERHAAHRLAVEADLRRRHRQAHPLSRRRQRPHVAPARGAVDAPADAVGAPVRAVLPRAAVVPLQHHLGRRIRRVQIDVRVQRVAGADRHRVSWPRRNSAGAGRRPAPTGAQARRRTASDWRSPSSTPRRCRPSRPGRHRVVDPDHARRRALISTWVSAALVDAAFAASPP